MGISMKVSGAWKSMKAAYVNVGGTWKPCKNVYVRQGGVWRSLYPLTVSVSGSKTITLSNVRIGSVITISGTIVNNTYDPDDHYRITPSGATLISGSAKWGPYGGSYTNTYTATSASPSFTTVNDGLSSASATISYFYERRHSK